MQETSKHDPISKTHSMLSLSGTKYEGKQVDKMCHYCGGTGVHKPGQNCPACGIQCLKCGKYNHFAKCCNSERRQNTQMNRRSTRRNPNGQQQQQRVKKTTESSSESDEEFSQQTAKHVYHQAGRAYHRTTKQMQCDSE